MNLNFLPALHGIAKAGIGFAIICLQLAMILQPVFAQPSMEKADAAFWQQVQSVSDGFAEYAHENSRFPGFNQFGGEMVPVVRKALGGNLANPYYGERQDLVRHIRLEERMMADVDFRFFSDKTLDDERVDTYRTNPPSDWRGIPGTIVGVGNSKGDMIAFFGIGADGKPLADTVDNGINVKFAVVHLEK